MLGFGDSAKVIDFNDGRGMRIRHIARFCEVLGVESAHFVGNSMGAINMFVDATSESPVLPVRSMVTICGGGEIQRNEYSAALYDYDATLAGMRRIVEALFFDPAYPADDEYVQRRYESSIAPGAWEALAAARFRRPGLEPPPLPSSATGIRPHRRADAGGGGRRRQAAATGVGGGDRRHRFADARSAVVPRGRSLPADRAADGGQRAAADLPLREASNERCRVMTNELAGKVAIVTGGASGSGGASSRRFAAEGAKVVIADVDGDGGAALAAKLGADALFRRHRRVGSRTGQRLVDDGGRPFRRPAHHGQQRGGVGHHAPSLPRR